jgi:hypothetical protein
MEVIGKTAIQDRLVAVMVSVAAVVNKPIAEAEVSLLP